MKSTKILLGMITVVLLLASILCTMNDAIAVGLVTIIISSIFMLFWMKSVNGNYTNMTLFFVVFHILYGLSGPLNVVWGDGLHRIFSLPYNVDSFILGFSLASIGLIIGVISFNIMKKGTSDLTVEKNAWNAIKSKNKALYKLALLFSFSASAFEIINLIRIGGIRFLFDGKAAYQSLVSSLSLTLPSSEIIIVSFTLFGLYVSTSSSIKNRNRMYKSKIIGFLIVSFPYLLIKILLGQRGILLTLFISLFVGIIYFKPIKRVKPKIIIIVALVYIFMSFLFANRALVYLIEEDPSLFVQQAFKRERIIDALNPGASEFGSAFGNFSEFYNKYGTDHQLRFGTTYFKGAVIPIPSFIYPGEKPKQITYEFRDEFFLSEASRGAIAGTGFSSILEAYMNFHYIGVFFIYSIIGFYLQKIDKVYRYKSIFMMMLYLSTISLTISFHRSAFGTIFASVFLIAILTFIVSKTLRITTKVV